MKQITLDQLLIPLKFKQLRELCKKHCVQSGRSKAVTRERICSSFDVQLISDYDGNGKWTISIAASINSILVEQSGRIGKAIMDKLMKRTAWTEPVYAAEWASYKPNINPRIVMPDFCEYSGCEFSRSKAIQHADWCPNSFDHV